ncbi:MAG TPA: DUF3365 domain-containing protein, partial [Dissulfurispiraceae bacterium]|nr:DUF3365 domain-containing protein [Dissulfurispiraceae bacterium]
MGGIGHIRRSLSFQRTLSVKIIVGCSLALITALGVSFTVIAVRQERLIMEQVEREARILFSQIVVTRSWIADHGGIFIEKLPSMEASPYIRESEIVDLKGKRYIRKTPAMVTKDLAVYARERGLYWFHITSLTLTNPANAPDAFERKALEKFSLRQSDEVIAVETMGDGQALRYIAPLFVEEACMKCHSHQGYRVGDVRGAIGIVIPIEKTIAAIDSNRKGMIVAGLLTLITLVVALYLMLRALVLSPLGRLKESIQGFPEGRYSPDAALRTGDELEDLSNAFARMADTLTDYHSCLNDRIRAATGNLEAVNRKLVETNNLLQEVNARKSDCIARASHELRSPLT